MQLEEILIDCPYCGAGFTALVDCSAGAQDYVEDCHICCAPINFQITVDAAGELHEVRVRRDDE